MKWAAVLLSVMLLFAAGSCASTKPGLTGHSQAAGPGVKPPVSVMSPIASCGAFSATSAELAIDLAPPAGFTEICTRDRELCADLTAGYPPGVRTIGYFVPSDEWVRYQRGDHSRFSRYLIAQATTTRASAFPALKDFIRSRSGRIPDSSRLSPKILRDLERVDLGVLDEGADFISPGVLLDARPSPQMPPLGPQVAINTAFATSGQVLSLYTHHNFSGERDLDACKQLTTQWLKCLRGAAQPGVEPAGPSARGLTP